VTIPKDEDRRQTPEEVLLRISGVPKKPEEQKAELQTLQKERARQWQNAFGTDPSYPSHPSESVQPTPPARVETERQQRDKA
jgi:hypothetical protein